jgi:hypothetical protein
MAIIYDFENINRRMSNPASPNCEYCHCTMVDGGNSWVCGRSECNAFGRRVLKPFVCPRCGFVSHHPKDKEHGYCICCHVFIEAHETRDK